MAYGEAGDRGGKTNSPRDPYYIFISGRWECIDVSAALAIVYNWRNELRRGRTKVTDDLREGRPPTATTEDDVSAVRLVVETDKRVTYRQMRTSSGIGMSQVHKIPREHLIIMKVRTLWIPHNLTEAQKLHRVTWCREMMQIYSGGDTIAVHDIVKGVES
ncbi:Putative uncharacterized protein FLJ37770 [Eumeta japonica]|uniref:Histone-lysine N-methyltransferase SETMAR n=1 Tax=Eumeta variegata TaxID=151549 RepID=A0A4C1YZA1_EUMVA|nr:Putative uncharacterized protein FLJ37770 [Eumeta japonica]